MISLNEALEANKLLRKALEACIVEADLAGSAHTLPMIDAHCDSIRVIARNALDSLDSLDSQDMPSGTR